jgi:histidinol-phosphate aminotransferase
MDLKIMEAPAPKAHLRNLPTYEPGRPIEDVARELGLDPSSIIKLASNENPLGPSPKAIQAIKEAAAQVHIYPDGNGYLLRQAIAKRHSLKIEQVALGNGSNEIIEFLGHSFLAPGDEIVISQYAFVVYELVGRLFQAEVRKVSARNYGHDLEGMLKAVTSKTRLLFVANPNNPTGTAVPASELGAFIMSVPKHVVVVLDEAYQEFLGDVPDTAALISKHPNLVVMRTFSKAQGLAGLRIGYGLGSTEVIGALQKVRQPFQANSIAQSAALAALGDNEHVRKTVEVVTVGRSFLEEEFKKRKLEFVPSTANFILVRVGDGKKTFDSLMKRGVIVRPMAGYELPEWIRVTVGTREENQKFLSALDSEK